METPGGAAVVALAAETGTGGGGEGESRVAVEASTGGELTQEEKEDEINKLVSEGRRAALLVGFSVGALVGPPACPPGRAVECWPSLFFCRGALIIVVVGACQPGVWALPNPLCVGGSRVSTLVIHVLGTVERAYVRRFFWHGRTCDGPQSCMRSNRVPNKETVSSRPMGGASETACTAAGACHRQYGLLVATQDPMANVLALPNIKS